MTGERETDSAGVPWAGRHFEPTAYENDDGSAPERLTEALRRFAAREVGHADVVAALRGVRLLVPLLARLGEAAPGPHGRLVEKSADLALVTVSAPDGRRALPAFTSVGAMSAWNRSARPVPVESERVMLAAAAEDTPLVVLDARSPTEFAVRRPAVWALGRGQVWVPAVDDPEVGERFAVSAAEERDVLGIALGEGDSAARLAGPELIVQLTLAPGLDRASLAELLRRLQSRWAEDAVLAERVDSMTVRLRAES